MLTWLKANIVVIGIFLSNACNSKHDRSLNPLINNSITESKGIEEQDSQTSLKSDYIYACGVSSGDLDGDGSVDLVTANASSSDLSSDLLWFQNDGSGKFHQHFIAQGGEGILERNSVADINADGKPDVVIVDWLNGAIYWYENSLPSDQQWERHVISQDVPFAYDVSLEDFDNDGYLDVAASGHKSGQVSLHLNPQGKSSGSNWMSTLVESDLVEARTIRAGDFNRDGKMDLLVTDSGLQNIPIDSQALPELDLGTQSTHRSQVLWYENTGDPFAWIKHEIDLQSRAPIHGTPVDMNGDGLLDIVMAFGMRSDLAPEAMHEIAWYESLESSGKSWKKHSVGALPYAFEAIAADVNGDGTNEIIASAWAKGDKIVWFERNSNAADAWDMKVIANDFFAANQVIVSDLNSDGTLDVISTADNGSSRIKGSNELRWWRNSGHW